MAEIAVNLVIDKLGPLLFQEINLLRGVRKEIEELQTELKSIRSFLKDAEAKAAVEDLQGKKSDEGVQLWVEQVREVAYTIEDIIDEFSFTVAQLPHGKGLAGVFQKICRSVKKLKLRCNIANDIQDINSKLRKIKERKCYEINSIEEGSSSGTKNIMQNGGYEVGSYYMEEDQIVGYDSIRKELHNWTIERIPQRKVMVLIGAGGLGKTTLAANAYKNKDVKSHFNCHAWIHVGRTYRNEDLLKEMIQKFYSSMEQLAPRNIETMDEIELVGLLRKYLESKSYIIVFDDVWKDEFWADVEHALFDNNKNSRLIVTTRNKSVAHLIPTSIVQISMLKGLHSDKAWQLFCRKAFNSDEFCPPELKDLSNKILEKCGGLPLAIVAVGGLLSKKENATREWQKLLSNLGSELGSDPHLKSCNRVLSEGYNDLPHHIKPCLLYFGLFPESYVISRGRLIRLWIAEGFIQVQSSNNKRLEEIGEDYLTELIHRSLVQVSDTNAKGKVKRCRVHDLMHEIIFKKMKQLGFGRVLNEYDVSQSRKTRRFNIQKSTDNILKKINNSKVRSIIFFGLIEQPQSFFETLIFVDNFKLMTVLDFEDAAIDYLPEGVGNFFHLHYLSLRNTNVKRLPKTIGKLVNLETLNLTGTLVSELPVEINHLKKLRYLRTTRSIIGTKIHEGFGSLMDIQKLGWIQVNSKAPEDLKKLRQLRRLMIQLVNGNDQKGLFSCFANMKDLTSLGIELLNREDILDIESVASPPKYLQILCLGGILKKLPVWIPSLQNLKRLCLFRSGLSSDPMRVLHTLSNLLELWLVEAYNGEQLHIKQGWLPKLQRLYLLNSEGLKFITIEDGAIPLLERLWISACPLLKEIPTGIESLRNLRALVFGNMLKQLESGIIIHETWEKLKHIPKAIVLFQGEDGEWIHKPVRTSIASTP